MSKRIYALVLVLTLLLTGCSVELAESEKTAETASEPTEPVAKIYVQSFGGEETIYNTAVHTSRLERMFTTEESISQTNTLTLNSDGRYTLRKLLLSAKEDGLRLEYTFEGTYQTDEDKIVLDSAKQAEAEVKWGELSYAFASEEGSFDSQTAPWILNYFDGSFMGQYNGNNPMTVTLNDADGSFAVVSEHPMVDALNLEILEDSTLKDLKIIFLGSSVTFGVGREGVSFVEIMAKRHGFDYVKEAVSGTTLVTAKDNSYVHRLLERVDTTYPADLLVCQLSTNDASEAMPLGEISTATALEEFDTTTICGAIEYIIAYTQQTYGCPVVFYTGTRYDSEQYGQMVALLHTLEEKWENLYVIDLWNNDAMTNIDKQTRASYMNDQIHPNLTGYCEWWMPQIEQELYDIVQCAGLDAR